MENSPQNIHPRLYTDIFTVYGLGLLHVAGGAPPARGRAGSGVCPRDAAAERPVAPTPRAHAPTQDALEGAAELGVEDGVDERVEEAVDVAEPDEQREQPRLDVAHARPRRRRRDVTSASGHEQVVAQADGVDDVDGEERRPAQQKHA